MLRRSRRIDLTVPGFVDVVRIGEGRSSIVYRARVAETDAPVALKVSRSRDLPPDAVEAFIRAPDARSVLARHPNIVSVFKALRLDDGRLVACVELCRGTLHAAIRRPLTPELATGIGVKIAGALESAHQLGVTHDDVTTRNVMVRTNGQPAIRDFGAAQFRSEADAGAANLDGFANLHVAPEVLDGAPGSVQADVYGLASTIYTAVAGYAPFAPYADESIASVAMRILHDDPPGDQRIPLALFDVLARALAKDPAQRPQSAALFAAELNEAARQSGWPRVQPVVIVPSPDALASWSADDL